MQLSLKYSIILAIVLAVVASAITKHYFPNTQVKTEVKTQIVEHEVVKNNIVTVTETTKKPDGTVVTETTTKDMSTTVQSEQEKSDTKSTQVIPPQWLVGAGVEVGSVSGLTAPDYRFQVSRRILGPVFLGVDYKTGTAKEAGAFLQLEF